MRFQMSFSLAAFLILFSAGNSWAENPTCSAAMTPAQCAEAQITAISKIFGEYQQTIASLRNELDTSKAEIATLKDRVAALETDTKTLAKETELIRPGGPGCLLTRDNTVLPGWQVKGEFGVIQFRPLDGGRNDAFRRGGQFNTDHWWEHGDIVCAR
ncbi:hypothetical protein LZK77_16225 [Rhizobium leguminosarum]|nr:hypothetical protein LZK77_16225 [Rhizobium leguminosarum]